MVTVKYIRAAKAMLKDARRSIIPENLMILPTRPHCPSDSKGNLKKAVKQLSLFVVLLVVVPPVVAPLAAESCIITSSNGSFSLDIIIGSKFIVVVKVPRAVNEGSV